MVQAVPAASPRGPALQLRCLACHQALGAGDDVTRITGRLEVPAAPVDVQWYAMVHGEVVGPIGREDLAGLHRKSVLDDDALVWHQGFRGWARLADTATFAPLVGGRKPAPRSARMPAVDLTEDLEEMVTAPRRMVVPPPIPRRMGPPPIPRRMGPPPIPRRAARVG
jgi:hypothetical protein